MSNFTGTKLVTAFFIICLNQIQIKIIIKFKLGSGSIIRVLTDQLNEGLVFLLRIIPVE